MKKVRQSSMCLCFVIKIYVSAHVYIFRWIYTYTYTSMNRKILEIYIRSDYNMRELKSGFCFLPLCFSFFLKFALLLYLGKKYFIFLNNIVQQHCYQVYIDNNIVNN